MSRTCQVTGATPRFGHHVSHSHRPTERRFDVNIQSQHGIDAGVAALLARGEKI